MAVVSKQENRKIICRSGKQIIFLFFFNLLFIKYTCAKYYAMQ